MSKIELRDGAAPMEIPYMPAGEHTICASINGEPGKRRVVVDAAAVGRLNADLAELQEEARAGRRPRPVVFFDHKQGEAAAFPKRFRWDEQEGILLELEGWSDAGRAAVLGRNYGYVSPCFRLSRGDGQVLGLVGGVEVASLVNDPAFQQISPLMADGVAAARAEMPAEGVDFVGATQMSTKQEVENGEKAPYNDAEPKNGVLTMNEETKKKLGLEPDADDAAVEAAVDALLLQREEHKKKAEELEAECKKKDDELQAAHASEKEAWLNGLKERGVLAPQDEEAVSAASELFDANPKAARTAYSKMQGADDAPIIKASHALPASKGGERAEDFISFPNL